MTFASILLDWFETHGRDLPWRRTRNPYAVWLSEIILQQTRISQGMAYWERFMTVFPTVDDLAAASEDDVLKLWQGLGYYSRARNLHKAARQIVALGHFPDTVDEIRQLKGVGEYTAAAIASFAFGIPAAAVDGNFFRVLARVYGIDLPINSSEGKRLFGALARQIVVPETDAEDLETAPVETLEHAAAVLPFRRVADGGAGQDGGGVVSARLNAAMMDFGATQCTPRAPACGECPFAHCCVARRLDTTERLPVKLKTIKIKTVRMAYIYLRCNGLTAVRRRPEGDIWQGLWEPYAVEASGGAWQDHPDLVMLRRHVKHVLTHRVILADFYLLETDAPPTLPDGYIWIKETELERYAVPRLVEIMLETIADRQHREGR